MIVNVKNLGMKRLILITWMLIGIIGSVSAQHDDLYFVPKKKKTEVAKDVTRSSSNAVSATDVPAKTPEMDEDAYNRRSSYLTEQGEAVSEFAMSDEGFVLITEEGDTMWMNTDTLRLARVADDAGWVNGFEGSDSDYEYAMRIVRFRNPRYAIPVSSPLYWDVVYGGALWPSWDWNIYDDGMYAYVFPSSSNWYYWDYMMGYPLGWSTWHSPWSYHYGYHWGHHYGWSFYGHGWYDPWCGPYYHGYHHGHHYGYYGHHHGHHHGVGSGRPGYTGPKAYPNDRTSAGASTRRDPQPNAAAGAARSERTSATSNRAGTGTERSSSVRVVTGRTESGSTTSGAVRSSGANRSGDTGWERRSTGNSSVNRSTSSGSTSRSSATRQSTSRSGSYGASYGSSGSTSSVSRSASSSRSANSYSSGSSSSLRSSYSGSSSRSSSSSYSGSSSRSSGSSYSGGSSRSSGSRR